MPSPKSELVATAGYKAWNEAHSRYETATVAVHGGFPKHGLATKLLRMIEEEVTSRTREMGGSTFELLVRTGKETNEWY